MAWSEFEKALFVEIVAYLYEQKKDIPLLKTFIEAPDGQKRNMAIQYLNTIKLPALNADITNLTTALADRQAEKVEIENWIGP